MIEQKEKWLSEPICVADLSILMKEAREYHQKNSELTTFELREAIAHTVTYHLKKHGIKTVIITQFLLRMNDPDYMPVINCLKEYGAKIFVEFN